MKKEGIGKSRIDELREASGKVIYTDPLTSFFYELIRDELPAGTVEKIVRNVAAEGNKEIVFTNGWLAQYAHNLAELILSAKAEKLEFALSKVFEEKGSEKTKEINKIANISKSLAELESFNVEELEELEKKVVNVYQQGNSVEHKTLAKEIKQDPITFDKARSLIDQLRAEGKVSEEEIARMYIELDEIKDEITENEEGELRADLDDNFEKEEEMPIEEPKKCCGNCHKHHNTIQETEKNEKE